MTTREAPNDRAERIALVGLAVVGLAQLALHPVKTYGLIVRGRGWYDA